MKKLLFRNLLTNYMIFFVIALFSTSIIIWVFQAVNYLDIILEDGRDYVTYLKYSLLNLPKILSKLFPFVIFFSLFYVTIKHEINNELIIFWNFGVNKMEIVNFIFKFSFILMLIQLFLTSIVIPKSQDLARSYLRNSNVSYFGNFIKAQKFNDNIKGVTIYSEKKDDKGNLINLFLKKEINEKEFTVIYAKKGSFVSKNGIPVLLLHKGEQLTAKNNNITSISFSKSDFPLQNLETNTTTYKKTQEVGTISLFNCAHNIFYLKNKIIKKIENCSLKNLENIFREIYKRIIIPIYIPLFCLIPFVLLFYSKENKNYYRLRIFTFLIGILSIIISEITLRFISKDMSYNIIFLLLPIFFILILYLILNQKFNPKTFRKL